MGTTRKFNRTHGGVKAKTGTSSARGGQPRTASSKVHDGADATKHPQRTQRLAGGMRASLTKGQRKRDAG